MFRKKRKNIIITKKKINSLNLFYRKIFHGTRQSNLYKCHKCEKDYSLLQFMGFILKRENNLFWMKEKKY